MLIKMDKPRTAIKTAHIMVANKYFRPLFFIEIIILLTHAKRYN